MAFASGMKKRTPGRGNQKGTGLETGVRGTLKGHQSPMRLVQGGGKEERVLRD